MVFLWWCGDVFVWCCFCGGVFVVGVLVVMFLWWCSGVFLVVVFLLWWCGGVFVLVWYFCCDLFLNIGIGIILTIIY